ARIQRLSDEAAGNRDPYQVESRLAVRRQIGGTSILWGGRCVPFDPIDFEARPAQPHDLWPVPYDELARHLPKACEWCVCGEAVFDVRGVANLREREMIGGLPDDV